MKIGLFQTTKFANSFVWAGIRISSYIKLQAEMPRNPYWDGRRSRSFRDGRFFPRIHNQGSVWNSSRSWSDSIEGAR